MNTTRARVLLGLGLGVIVLSFASVLIRLTPAASIVIAAGRMAISTLILTPLFFSRLPAARAELRGVSPWPLVVSGLLLGAHFALWIESLNRTSVVSSVVLVTMDPIFVSLLSPLFVRERASARVWLAVVLGVVGALVVAGPNLGSASLTSGNLLAVGGSVCAAGYLLVGRSVRPRVSLLTYIFIVYGIAALALVPVALASRAQVTGLPPRAWLFIALLAVGPQLLGHTAFNWALRWLATPVVAMAILGEPVGTSLLAWAILGETPRVFELLGGLVILTAIYLAATDRQKPALEPTV